VTNTKDPVPNAVKETGIVQFTRNMSEIPNYTIRYMTSDPFPYAQFPYRSVNHLQTADTAINWSASGTPDITSCRSIVNALSTASPFKSGVGNAYLNWGGLNEKWFQDKNGAWYYIFNIQGNKKHTIVLKHMGGLTQNGGLIKNDQAVVTSNISCYLAIQENIQFP